MPPERVNNIIATSPVFAASRVTVSGAKGSPERRNALAREQAAMEASTVDPGANRILDPIAAFASEVPKGILGIVPGALSLAGTVADVVPGLHELEVGPALQSGADYLNRGLEYAFPKVPGGHWVSEALGGGVGSLIGMGLTGGAGAALAPARAAQAAKKAALVANFLAEGGGAATQGIRMAEQEGDGIADRSYGASAKRAAKSLGYGTYSTAIEKYLGAPRFIGKFFERGAQTGLWPALRQTLPEWIVGPGQESLQQIGQDIIYEGKPNWNNILPAAVGGLVQGPFATFANLSSQANAKRLANQMAPLRERSEGMTQLQTEMNAYARLMDDRNLTSDEEIQFGQRIDAFKIARADREDLLKSIGMARSDALERQFLEQLKLGQETGPHEEQEILSKIAEGRMAAEAMDFARQIEHGASQDRIAALANEKAERQFEWQVRMQQLLGLNKRETLPGQPIPILQVGETLDDVRSLAFGQRLLGRITRYNNLTPLQRGAVQMLARSWTPEALTPESMPEAINNVRERTAYPERKTPSIHDIWTFAGMQHEPSAGWFTEAQGVAPNFEQLKREVPSDKKRSRRVRGAQQIQGEERPAEAIGGTVSLEGEGAQAPAAGGVLQETKVAPTPVGGVAAVTTTTVQPPAPAPAKGKRRYRAGTPVMPAEKRLVRGGLRGAFPGRADVVDPTRGRMTQAEAQGGIDFYDSVIAQRLGATIKPDPTLDRPAKATIDESGNVEIFYNPNTWATMDETQRRVVMYEEIIHAAHFVLLADEWIKAGAEGSLVEYIEKRMTELSRELPEELRRDVVENYGAKTESEIFVEYVRALVQQMRTGRVSELYQKGLTPKVIAYIRNLIQQLRRIMSGDIHPAVKREFDNINKFLDLAERKTPETPTKGIPAAERQRVASVLQKLGQMFGQKVNSVNSEQAAADLLAGATPSIKNKAGQLKVSTNPAAIAFMMAYEKQIPIKDIKDEQELMEWSYKMLDDYMGKKSEWRKVEAKINWEAEVSQLRAAAMQGNMDAGVSLQKLLNSPESSTNYANAQVHKSLVESRAPWDRIHVSDISPVGDDVYTEAVLAKWLSGRVEPHTSAPGFIEPVFQDLYSAIGKEKGISVENKYRELSSKQTNKFEKEELKDGRVWVKIPSRQNDNAGFAENAQILKSVSCRGWCTYRGRAEDLLSYNDFYLLMNGPLAEAAIVINPDGTVNQVQDHKNTGYGTIVGDLKGEVDRKLNQVAPSFLNPKLKPKAWGGLSQMLINSINAGQLDNDLDHQTNKDYLNEFLKPNNLMRGNVFRDLAQNPNVDFYDLLKGYKQTYVDSPIRMDNMANVTAVMLRRADSFKELHAIISVNPKARNSIVYPLMVRKLHGVGDIAIREAMEARARPVVHGGIYAQRGAYKPFNYENLATNTDPKFVAEAIKNGNWASIKKHGDSAAATPVPVKPEELPAPDPVIDEIRPKIKEKEAKEIFSDRTSEEMEKVYNDLIDRYALGDSANNGGVVATAARTGVPREGFEAIHLMEELAQLKQMFSKESPGTAALNRMLLRVHEHHKKIGMGHGEYYDGLRNIYETTLRELFRVSPKAGNTAIKDIISDVSDAYNKKGYGEYYIKKDFQFIADYPEGFEYIKELARKGSINKAMLVDLFATHSRRFSFKSDDLVDMDKHYDILHTPNISTSLSGKDLYNAFGDRINELDKSQIPGSQMSDFADAFANEFSMRATQGLSDEISRRARGAGPSDGVEKLSNEERRRISQPIRDAEKFGDLLNVLVKLSPRAWIYLPTIDVTGFSPKSMEDLRTVVQSIMLHSGITRREEIAEYVHSNPLLTQAQKDFLTKPGKLSHLSISPEREVQAYYRPSDKSLNFNLDHISTETEAIAKFFHELTHGRIDQLSSNADSVTELEAILNSAEKSLVPAVTKQLLKEGWPSLEALIKEYGFDMSTEKGRNMYLGELLSRYAETVDYDSAPGWFKTLMNMIRTWLAKHLDFRLTEKDIAMWLKRQMSGLATQVRTSGVDPTTQEVQEGLDVIPPPPGMKPEEEGVSPVVMRAAGRKFEAGSQLGTKVERGINLEAVLNLLRGNQDGGKKVQVMEREMVQNALDEVRKHVLPDPTGRDPEIYYYSQLEDKNNPKGATYKIVIGDNGRGMSPQFLVNKYIKMGQSEKDIGESGGLGIAKGQFFGNATKFIVDSLWTDTDGTRYLSTMRGTPEGFMAAQYPGDLTLQEGMNQIVPGLTLEIIKAEKDSDFARDLGNNGTFVTGEKFPVLKTKQSFGPDRYPTTEEAIDKTRRFNPDVRWFQKYDAVNPRQEDTTQPYYTLMDRVGMNGVRNGEMTAADPPLLDHSIDTPYATIDIMSSRRTSLHKTKYHGIPVYSNGVYQFTHDFQFDDELSLPSFTFINVKSKVKGSHEHYPFPLDRGSLKPGEAAEVENFFKTLESEQRNRKVDAYRQAMTSAPKVTGTDGADYNILDVSKQLPPAIINGIVQNPLTAELMSKVKAYVDQLKKVLKDNIASKSIRQGHFTGILTGTSHAYGTNFGKTGSYGQIYSDPFLTTGLVPDKLLSNPKKWGEHYSQVFNGVLLHELLHQVTEHEGESLSRALTFHGGFQGSEYRPFKKAKRELTQFWIRPEVQAYIRNTNDDIKSYRISDTDALDDLRSQSQQSASSAAATAGGSVKIFGEQPGQPAAVPQPGAAEPTGRARRFEAGAPAAQAEAEATEIEEHAARLRTELEAVPVTRNEQGQLTAPNGKPSELTEYRYRQVRTPRFKAWFGDWENDPANASKVVDENGEPRVVYHGSRASFNKFKPRTDGSAFSTFLGNHFANDPGTADAFTIGKYARVELESSEYIYDEWGEFDEEAMDRMEIEPGGRTYAVFLNVRNPLDIRPDQGKWESDDDAVQRNVSLIAIKQDPGVRNVIVDGMDKDDVSRNHPEAAENQVTSSTHALPRHAYPQAKQAFIDAGYDGVAYTNNGEHEVQGVDDPTAYIIINPDQAKSAIGNSGEFDPNAPPKRFMASAPQGIAAVRTATTSPGLEAAQIDRIKKVAGVQRQMVPDTITTKIEDWLTNPDVLQEERMAGGLLSWLHDFATSVPSGADIAAQTDPTLQKEMALRAVEMNGLALKRFKSMKAIRDRKWKELDKAAMSVPRSIDHEAAGNYLKKLIKEVPALYNKYMRNRLFASARGDPTAHGQIKGILAHAESKANKELLDEATVTGLLQAIADNPAIPAGAGLRTSDILAVIRANRVALTRAGMDPETVNYMIDGGPGRLGPALSRIRNLGRTIATLRNLRSTRETAARDAFNFSNWWGNEGRPVTLEEFSRRFAAFVRRHTKESDAASELFEKYGSARDSFNAYDLAIRELSDLIQSPQYQEQLKYASKLIDVRPHRQMSFSVADASHIITVPDTTDPNKTNTYRVSLEPGKDIERRNKVQIDAAIDNIRAFLAKPDISESDRYSYTEILAWLINQKSDTTWGTEKEGLRGYQLRHGLQQWPGFGFTGTLRSVLREITGRTGERAERLASMVDRHEDVTRGVSENPIYGDNAINVALGKAMKAHDMDLEDPYDLEEYEQDIASPIFDTRQHTESQHLVAGNTVPHSGKRVLPEDMHLISLLKKHDDALKTISEEGISLYGEPGRIQDEIADVHLNRLAVAKGPNVVPRRFTQRIGNMDAITFAREWERKTEAEKDAWITDKENFKIGILAYATSTNPDYNRGNEKYEQAFKEVTKRIRERTITVEDFDELAQAVADAKGELLTPAFQADLEKTIVDRLRDGMDKYTRQRIDVSTASLTREEITEGVSNIQNISDKIKRMLVLSLRTEGSFLVPRGKMLLPGSFYQYARTVPAHRAALRANSVNISRVKLLGAMEQVISALKLAEGKMDADINAAERADKGKGGRKAIAKLRNEWRSGDSGYTHAQLKSIIRRLERETNWAYQAMLHRQSGFDSAKTEILKSLRQLLGLNLLASFNAQLTNITGGTSLPTMVLRALTRNYRSILSGAASVPWRIVKHTTVGAANQLSKIPGVKGVAKAMSKITGMNGVYRAIADAVGRQNQMYNDLVEQGIITPFDRKGRIESRKYFGGWGPAMPGDKGELGRFGWATGKMVGISRFLKNNRLTDLVSQSSPRWADLLANMISVEETMKQMTWLQSKARGIADSRPRGLTAADASNPTYQIKAKEMGISDQQLTQLRAILRETGSLEKVMFDYIDRSSRAATPGTEPFLTKQDQEKFIRSIGYLGNLVKDSNSPAWYRTGDIQGMIGQFGSWPANARDAMSLMAMAKRAAASGKKEEFDSLARAILVLLLLTIIGSGSRELGAEIQDLLSNRAPSKARLANVVDNPISWDGFRYALVSLGQLTPYLGNIADRMLGGGNSRPLLDATSAIPMAGLGANAVDAAVKIWQGGDPVATISDFSNRWLPVNAAVNRIPSFAQYQEARNALRSARAGVPSDIEIRQPSAGQIRPGPLTADMAKLERAAYAGDSAGVQRIYTGMVEKTMKDKGLDEKEATRRVQSSLRSKTLENRIFARQLSESEFGEFTGNLTGGQRANVQKAFAAENLIRSATGMSDISPRAGAVATTKRRTRGAKTLTLTERSIRSRKLRRTRLLKGPSARRRMRGTRRTRKEKSLFPSDRHDRRLRSLQVRDVTLSDPFGRSGRRRKNNLLFLEQTQIEP